MSLRIKSIKLHNFRRYEQLFLSDLGRLTVFVGPNAVGKTSIIEGIQLLTALNSLRHCSMDEMVRFGSENARISAEATDEHRLLEIALTITDKSRKYTLNGKAKRVADLRGQIPAVTFSPDDLDLVKGSHSKRRHALDALGSQLNSNYLQLLHDFEKIHRHKTRLLKDAAPIDLIEAVNATFVRVSAQLTNYRRRLFERLLPHMQQMYAQIANGEGGESGEGEECENGEIAGGEGGVTEKLDGTYIASWEDVAPTSNTPIMPTAATTATMPVAAGILTTTTTAATTATATTPTFSSLEEAVASSVVEEVTRGRALQGAHLDTINFTIGGLDAQKFASQGQQRSLVLAWKLAEVELINEMIGQLPILLLDDVMSELDENRRAALMRYLSCDLQAFITTANADYFTPEMLAEANVIKLTR